MGGTPDTRCPKICGEEACSPAGPPVILGMPGKMRPDILPENLNDKDSSEQAGHKQLQEITTGGGVNVGMGILIPDQHTQQCRTNTCCDFSKKAHGSLALLNSVGRDAGACD